MVFVKVGKVRISPWKLLICKDNTLFRITFDLLVPFRCFNFCLKALDVYFTRRPCFYFWVGSFLLESAEKRTNESKKPGLRLFNMLVNCVFCSYFSAFNLQCDDDAFFMYLDHLFLPQDIADGMFPSPVVFNYLPHRGRGNRIGPVCLFVTALKPQSFNLGSWNLV